MVKSVGKQRRCSWPFKGGQATLYVVLESSKGSRMAHHPFSVYPPALLSPEKA